MFAIRDITPTSTVRKTNTVPTLGNRRRTSVSNSAGPRASGKAPPSITAMVTGRSRTSHRSLSQERTVANHKALCYIQRLQIFQLDPVILTAGH